MQGGHKKTLPTSNWLLQFTVPVTEVTGCHFSPNSEISKIAPSTARTGTVPEWTWHSVITAKQQVHRPKFSHTVP